MARVTHFEIPVDDGTKAADFYRQVVGWELKPRVGSWGTFLAIQTGDESEKGIDGSFFRKSTVPPEFARVINTIDVENLDESMDKVKANNGEIVFGPIDYADLGRLAYFRDPEGNILGMIERNPK